MYGSGRRSGRLNGCFLHPSSTKQVAELEEALAKAKKSLQQQLEVAQRALLAADKASTKCETLEQQVGEGLAEQGRLQAEVEEAQQKVESAAAEAAVTDKKLGRSEQECGVLKRKLEEAKAGSAQASEKESGPNMLRMDLSGSKLSAKDLTGSSDPYCVVRRISDGTMIGKTETLMGNLNPHWNPLLVALEKCQASRHIQACKEACK